MMKKILLALFFISTIAQAQYKVVGTLSPKDKHTTAILYQIIGAKQNYIGNTKINNGNFVFAMDDTKNSGVYRVTFDARNNGFVDFFYNNEDVIFAFNPTQPEATKTFSISDENKLYGKYIEAISYMQYDIDSLQVAYLKNPSEKTKNQYKSAIENINAVQKKYVDESKNKLIHEFVKATDRYNASTIAKTPNEYLSGVKTHFFDNIDFENQTLYNSPFLVDRISDYIFYINYSDDVEKQIELHQQATSEVINKIKNPDFKQEVIQYLINEFKTKENIYLVDYLFENHFDKLPQTTENTTFKKSVLIELNTAIGRTAPNFSWKENGKTINLKELNDGKNYILTFYSATCSHCVNEIPKLHTFLKDKPNTSVIAFAMEDNNLYFKEFTKNFTNWHNVLGLNKWENKIARMYNIVSTPTYFVLNADKVIIAKPEHLEDVQAIFE